MFASQNYFFALHHDQDFEVFLVFASVTKKSRLWGDPFVVIDTVLIVAENVAIVGIECKAKAVPCLHEHC